MIEKWQNFPNGFISIEGDEINMNKANSLIDIKKWNYTLYKYVVKSNSKKINKKDRL
jgi:hypothetical protein